MELAKYLSLENPVNPYWLIRREYGEFILKHRLRLAGYAAKQDVLEALVEALFNLEIMLLEGLPGAGKTTLYTALCAAFGLNPKYRMQCHEESTHFHIVGQFQTSLQNQFVIQQTATHHIPFDDVAAEQWTLRFFKPGIPLAAYTESPRGSVSDEHILPNILLLDEIDKLRETTQDSCLQLFHDKFATVEELLPVSSLGLPEGALMPIVLFTSNNMRGGVSAPLRDRAGVYIFIETPTVSEETTILKTKFPDLSDNLIRQTVRLINAVRSDDMIRQKPQIRAADKFVRSLISRNVTDLGAAGEDLGSESSSNPQRNAEIRIRKRIGSLFKQGSDYQNAFKSLTGYAAQVVRETRTDAHITDGLDNYYAQDKAHAALVRKYFPDAAENAEIFQSPPSADYNEHSARGFENSVF